jgi:phospholipid/cholesterol/gamma-HCH transport system substrate-binding protein
MKSLVKVGIFATLCLIVLAILIWKIEDLNPFSTKGQRIDAVFKSVAGLDDKASVRIAGVRVGRVDGLGLQGTQARITLALDKPLGLTQGTTAKIASLGMLGEKYVELVPGPPNAPPLPPDAVLSGTTPAGFDEAMEKINAIGSSIQQLTGSVAGSDVGGNINRLVSDIQLTSAEIRALVAENRANVASSIRNFDQVSATLARELPRLADQMDRTLAQLSGVIQENRGDLSASMSNARELTEKLQVSADNLNQISGKIASGQGTIGKLVNDEKAYDQVISTLDSIQGGVKSLSETFGGINKFNIGLDMQGYYLPDLEESNSSFRLDIDPQDGKRLYRAGIVSSPTGKRREKTQTITETGPDGIPQTTTINTITQERSYSATALFGYKAPQDVRLFAGLIEGTGGAQVEYPLPFFNRKVNLSFEAFDFSRPNDEAPHLRLLGRYQFHPNLYIVGGYDDFLENDALFLGGGIRWTDENIKFLLGLAGSAMR